MINRVLLVDDEPLVREALAQTLDLAGLHPVAVGSFIEAKDHIAAAFPGVVVSDIRMPGKDGFALLDHVQKVDRDLPVILLTGQGDIPMAVRGMAAGAFEFLEKPCKPQVLLAAVEKALRTRELVLENRRLRRQAEAGDAATRLLFGRSPQAEALRARARAAAKSQAEVLITGEPGTGTAKVAEVPAAGLSGEALAAGFTRAEGGTLFLDEVAALSAPVQFALDEQLDRRGRTRFIAGTYRNLEEEARTGRFSADLYYKLDVMRIRIPALRERKEDIPVLFRHYVSIACDQAALPAPEITPALTARLMAQEWPGNARALMNAAMRFAMGLSEPEEGGELGLNEQLAQLERSLLIEALRKHQGGATAAAEALKLPRKTFYDKLARHGIRPEDYRQP
jgi:two-component system C4-dicarboxylate transport response regulator DctD